METLVELPRGRVHVRMDGPVDGPVVVLVHGFSIASVVWEPNVGPLVAAGFRVVRMDNFGRGKSDRPRMRNDIDLFDAQVLGVLDALGLTAPVDVVGVSMGGAIAAVFAARHPARVRRLVLIAPAGKRGGTKLAEALLRVPGLGEVLFPTVGMRVLRAGIVRESADPAPLLADHAASAARPGFVRSLLSTIRHFPLDEIGDWYERLGRTGVPVLVIWGEADRVVPYAGAARVMAALPGARLVSVAGANHAVNEHAAGLVNQEIVTFLTG